MNGDERRERVLYVLSLTYTAEGVGIWWNHPNRQLHGMSAAEIWASGDAVLMARVESVAESLTGQVAT